MQPSRTTVVIAATLVALTAGTLTGIAVLHDRSSTSTEGTSASGTNARYCANMVDAIGLYVGNPVTQMGYRIGTVTDITPMGPYARVVFDVDSDRTLPASVKAVTRSKSLLADRSLELVGNFTDGPTLEPDACVDTANTYTPKTISEIAGSSADFLESLTSSGDTSVQDSIDGLDQAMSGTQEAAHSMMTQAAAAAASPEQLTADIGSSIMNMAPLTEDALRNWGRIRSILDQMPEISGEATDLFAQVAKFDRGVGWLVAMLYDIQRNYGADIWPAVHGPITDLIRASAARTPDIQSLYETVPAVSTALGRQGQVAGGLSVSFTTPKANLDPQTCLTLAPLCEDASIDVLQLILRSGDHG